jgi:hypothetical protein
MPCELRLLNMRTFQKSEGKPFKNQVGLTLHRLLVDDCWTSFNNATKSQMCQINYPTDGQIDFGTFFEHLIPAERLLVQDTQLNFATKDSHKKILANEPIKNLIEPMEIKAFKINF